MKLQNKKYIRPVKAAKILKYHPNYVCKLARDGRLTRYYIGIRSYLLDLDEVLALPRKRA
jgi:hypothetical protein